MMETDNPGNLAGELLAMAQADQSMRHHFLEGDAEWDDSVDRRNTGRLGEIIAHYGWPTIRSVGADASNAAWLIAQHSPDLGFMKQCLELIKDLPAGEVDPANAAYLEDRILSIEGKPQIYGTQFRRVDNKLQAFPIGDFDHVDERRASVGLNSYAENEATLRAEYGS